MITHFVLLYIQYIYFVLFAIFLGTRSEALWDAEDERRVARVAQRLDSVARAAAAAQVGLLVDAEQTYFQPLIDAFVVDMQRAHNTTAATVWNTYQCYLRDAPARVAADLALAKREGWVWAAKLVRGAYMDTERIRAESLGQPSPVWDTIEQTHASYFATTDLVLDALIASIDASAPVVNTVASSGAGAPAAAAAAETPMNIGTSSAAAAPEPRVALLIASHNQTSLEHVASRLESLASDGIHTPAQVAAVRGNVCFGQLLGMADHLTYTLARHGLRAFKYVPYGPVMDVLPYLIRRAKENSNMLGGVGIERRMLWGEIKRRAAAALTGGLFASSTAAASKAASGAAAAAAAAVGPAAHHTHA